MLRDRDQRNKINPVGDCTSSINLLIGQNCTPNLDALNNPAMYRLYQSSQRSYFDVVPILPLLLMCYIAGSTRFNLQNIGQDGILFSLSFFFFIFSSMLLLPHLMARMVVAYASVRVRDWRIFTFCESLLLFMHRVNIEDMIVVMGSLIVGFDLIARVVAGQCPDMEDLWKSQSCNPYANMKSLPSDQVMLLYVVPLMGQSILRGVSMQALLIAWISNIIFVLVATLHVGGWLEAWVIIYSIIFINITYMIERLMRVTFVQSRATIAAVELNSQHEFDLLEISTDIERKVKEKEIQQLRSLMGNVAHDLKTPLHSIVADLEVLHVFFLKVSHLALDIATETLQNAKCGSEFDAIAIFNSLNATCQFMEMAINRSQDFMKASNNIALVPVMETFEMKSALSMSVTCLNRLQSGRTIVVHPFDAGICPDIISDKHWLKENALCLLSNAIKYSDDGVIDVCISLIDSPVRLCDKKVESFRKVEESSADSYTVDMVSMESRGVKNPFVPLRKMILLSVEDAGIGISKEDRSNLFQPFKQAQRMAGGTGLGLYSLSKRIEALGGSYGVCDRRDNKQGSQFWFTFPYRPDEAAQTATDAILGSDIICRKVSDSKAMSILIVDDSISILKVTSRLLRMNGHCVVTAPNGSVGLKMLKEAHNNDQFDMVLTDLQMPVMDGIEATKRFRKFELDELQRKQEMDGSQGGRRLLIIGMSANSDSSVRREALDSGMDHFCAKPFSYKDLSIYFDQPHGRCQTFDSDPGLQF